MDVPALTSQTHSLDTLVFGANQMKRELNTRVAAACRARGGKLRADCGKTRMKIAFRGEIVAKMRALWASKADSITEFRVGNAC